MPGNTAADADPEQYAQCDEPCFDEAGRGNAGDDPGSAPPRLAEQKSSNPVAGAADAYAPSGASNCVASATSTTPARRRERRERDFIADIVTRVLHNKPELGRFISPAHPPAPDRANARERLTARMRASA